MPSWWTRNPNEDGVNADDVFAEVRDQRGRMTYPPLQRQQEPQVPRPQWRDEIVATLPLSVAVRSVGMPGGRRYYSVRIPDLGAVAQGEGFSVAEAVGQLQARFTPIGIDIGRFVLAAISARRVSGNRLEASGAIGSGGGVVVNSTPMGGTSRAQGGPTDLSEVETDILNPGFTA